MSTTIRLTLNGEARDADVDGQETLLDVLQRCFGLRGARESCGAGVCGTCTVEVDGVPVSSCLYWAALADGTNVVTIEGVSNGDRLSDLQEAFVTERAFQCGYCTPGMIMMCRALLAENEAPDVETAREYLVGNVCRCGAYPEILKALLGTGQRAATNSEREYA